MCLLTLTGQLSGMFPFERAKPEKGAASTVLNDKNSPLIFAFRSNKEWQIGNGRGKYPLIHFPELS